jgi:heme exporter protein C
MREKITYGLSLAAAAGFTYTLYRMFFLIPDEVMQGAIYRIMFFHIPAAMIGMAGFFVAMTMSVWYIASKDLKFDSLAASVVEVSVIFATINIVTGMVWARIIWGVWWAWDYRLTSQLVCVLIFAGYVFLRRAIDEPTQRARLSAALCIFGCVDVVIVYKSIEWFRNNHPGPVLSFRTGGGHMDPAMENTIYLNLIPMLLMAVALVLIRTRQEATSREIDSLRRLAHAAA